jgi:hypothetical protein
MTRIYIASPYRIGDPVANVHRQIWAANKLMNAGFAVYVPLLSHFQHMMCPRPERDWLLHDLEWLRCCDAVLRLPGESKGADRECRQARKWGIPVWGDMDMLINNCKKI